MVYNLTIGNELKEGVYYNNGGKWFPVISDENVNAATTSPIIFLRQPGFLWLGANGELTDTLSFELVDKTGFTYQWYKRDPTTLLSTPITGATNDTLCVEKSNTSYGVIDEGTVYQFYCVVVSGAQYGVSGTGRAVFGTGARLANGGWIKVANANLGADQSKSLEDQIAYQPSATTSTVNDKNYDPTVYGDWYQWGRKKDGHENRKVLAAGTVSDYLNTAGGVETSKLDADGQIKNSETAYGKFILRYTSTYDWRQYPETNGNSIDNPADAWTWNNPANDPCKSLGLSWRVPTQFEWSQIISNNTWVWQDGTPNGTSGYLIKPGGANKPTSLFWPAGGIRNYRNATTSTGVGSRYWSSTFTSIYSYILFFDQASIAIHSIERATGIAVRCVSE
jgi:hypothetical protein